MSSGGAVGHGLLDRDVAVAEGALPAVGEGVVGAAVELPAGVRAAVEAADVGEACSDQRWFRLTPPRTPTMRVGPAQALAEAVRPRLAVPMLEARRGVEVARAAVDVDEALGVVVDPVGDAPRCRCRAWSSVWVLTRLLDPVAVGAELGVDGVEQDAELVLLEAAAEPMKAMSSAESTSLVSRSTSGWPSGPSCEPLITGSQA